MCSVPGVPTLPSYLARLPTRPRPPHTAARVPYSPATESLAHACSLTPGSGCARKCPAAPRPHLPHKGDAAQQPWLGIDHGRQHGGRAHINKICGWHWGWGTVQGGKGRMVKGVMAAAGGAHVHVDQHLAMGGGVRTRHSAGVDESAVMMSRSCSFIWMLISCGPCSSIMPASQPARTWAAASQSSQPWRQAAAPVGPSRAHHPTLSPIPRPPRVCKAAREDQPLTCFEVEAWRGLVEHHRSAVLDAGLVLALGVVQRHHHKAVRGLCTLGGWQQGGAGHERRSQGQHPAAPLPPPGNSHPANSRSPRTASHSPTSRVCWWTGLAPRTTLTPPPTHPPGSSLSCG